MKNSLRTTLALAGLTALAPAQHTTATTDSATVLARTKGIEEHEGDLRAAEAGYRDLLATGTPDAARAEAALRLGGLLWRLDRRSEATPFLQQAVAAGGAVGGEAQRILQGQGDADKLAQERLARARALVSRLFELLRQPTKDAGTEAENGALKSAQQELAWLGDAAATALVEMLRELRKGMTQDREYGLELDAAVKGLADQLWGIGTAPARKYLEEVFADPRVRWRRAIVARCGYAAPDMLTAAVPFLRDGDPAGDVQRSAARLAHRFPADLLVQLVTDSSADCRATGWNGLGERWHQFTAAEQEALVARIGMQLVAAIGGDDLRVRQAADSLRWNLAVQGPQGGRRLVLELLAKAPHKNAISDGAAGQFLIGDDDMRTLVAAGKALGPCPHFLPGIDNTGSPLLLTTVLALHEPRWSVASIEGLLDLLELGYGRSERGPRWATPVLSLATDAQVARLIAALPRMRAQTVLEVMCSRKPAPTWFPAIRTTVEHALAGTTDAWAAIGRSNSSGKEVENAGSEVILLLYLAGRTGHRDAAAWLGGLAQQHAALAGAAASALVDLSIAADDEAVRAQMRTLLVLPPTPTAGLPPNLRELLFAELTRLGDVPSIPLFPRAFALGLEKCTHPNATRARISGLQRLGLVDGVAWHGYDATHLVEAWHTMLASSPRVVADELIASRNQVPTGALPALVRRIPTFATYWEAADQRKHLSGITEQLRETTAADVAAGSDLRQALVELLRDANPMVVHTTIVEIPMPVLRELHDEARAAIRRTDMPGLFPRLHRAGSAVTSEEWRAGLQSDAWLTVLNAMPGTVDRELQREVEAMLQSPDSQRRAVACGALARWLSSDAVAPLLEALRDPSEQVRSAAADALQRIRFHQEQQAFWASGKDGIDTSSAATAGKLLAQARPGEAKEQRLLAIRSLEALGASEALPHLIDWTKDGDAEIAAAARSALTAIHQKAGARK